MKVIVKKVKVIKHEVIMIMIMEFKEVQVIINQ